MARKMYRMSPFDGGLTAAPREIAAQLPASVEPLPARVVPLNHYERGVLKKLLGDSLGDIQRTADSEHKSLEQFVREAASFYARRLRRSE